MNGNEKNLTFGLKSRFNPTEITVVAYSDHLHSPCESLAALAIVTAQLPKARDSEITEFFATVMPTQSILLPSAIADMLLEIATTGAITTADRYALMAAVFSETLQPEEREAVDRILWSVCRGRAHIVDQLSAQPTW